MKIDILKVVNGIMTAMAVVEKIKGASGAAKVDAVIDSTPDVIAAIELGIGKDILADERVVSAERNMIAGIIAFNNAVRDVKAAKGTLQPV